MTDLRTFTTEFLEKATRGRTEGAPTGDRVVTDSREPVKDALFVALRGPNFDGHDFVEAVFLAGATGAVVSREWHLRSSPKRSRPFLVVEDPLKALQDLARAHRALFDLPVAAVTGSNGKTTTKEMLAAALSPLGPVLRTRGNRNNHIGLPLTLLEIASRHRAAVVEIGLNHPGELVGLSRLARPLVAVITNVSLAHLEGLRDLDGVARAKAEITSGLLPEGALVVQKDAPPLHRALTSYQGRVVTFGLEGDADVHPSRVESKGLRGSQVDFPDGTRVACPYPGRHMVLNLLAAVAAAQVLGVPARLAGPAIERLEPVGGRMRPRRSGDLVVLDDTYNANPSSLRAALAVLEEQDEPGGRWAILGDMLELGDEAVALHRNAGKDAVFLDGLVTVGEMAREIGKGAVDAGLDPERVRTASDAVAAADILLPDLGRGGVVLVKGSRGMRMEAAVDRLLGGRV